MADRTLNDIKYVNAVPVSGRCSKCGRPFRTPAEAMADTGKATHDFYAAFESHTCDEDARQATARTMREAIEDH